MYQSKNLIFEKVYEQVFEFSVPPTIIRLYIKCYLKRSLNIHNLEKKKKS